MYARTKRLNRGMVALAPKPLPPIRFSVFSAGAKSRDFNATYAFGPIRLSYRAFAEFARLAATPVFFQTRRSAIAVRKILLPIGFRFSAPIPFRELHNPIHSIPGGNRPLFFFTVSRPNLYSSAERAPIAFREI